LKHTQYFLMQRLCLQWHPSCALRAGVPMDADTCTHWVSGGSHADAAGGEAQAGVMQPPGGRAVGNTQPGWAGQNKAEKKALRCLSQPHPRTSGVCRCAMWLRVSATSEFSGCWLPQPLQEQSAPQKAPLLKHSQ
jgi:hypothetical protein